VPPSVSAGQAITKYQLVLRSETDRVEQGCLPSGNLQLKGTGMKKYVCYPPSVLLLLIAVSFLCGCGLSANQRAGIETFSAAALRQASLTLRSGEREQGNR